MNVFTKNKVKYDYNSCGTDRIAVRPYLAVYNQIITVVVEAKTVMP